MDQLISEFSNQIKAAKKIGEDLQLDIDASKIQNILVCGLGGSGIGGRLISQLFVEDLKVPFSVISDYFIPQYVNEHTLVIASSYSGNTEETLEAFQKSLSRGAQAVAISTGGELEKLCEEKGVTLIKIPGGFPPRAALAYSLTSQMFVLSKLGLIRAPVSENLEKAISLLDLKSDPIKAEAKEVANLIGNNTPIIYSDSKIDALAVRFRQQINENAKTLCWHHSFPELTHNELVGWGNGYNNPVVLVLRTSDLYKRTSTRMELTRKEVEEKGASWRYIDAEVGSAIEEFLYLIHLVDWVSFYLSEIKKCDPIEVEVIENLKSQLAASK